jgi:acyl-coenzyme A thioesterase PaaI-like protein
MTPDTGEVTWVDDHWCIACGQENPHGLKLRFEVADGRIRTSCKFGKHFQGYAGVVHGGMLGLVLDEVMVMLPIRTLKVPVISAEMTLRLKEPARVGEKLIFTAEMEDKGRMILTHGEARREDGTLVATATAKCVRVKGSI